MQQLGPSTTPAPLAPSTRLVPKSSARAESPMPNTVVVNAGFDTLFQNLGLPPPAAASEETDRLYAQSLRSTGSGSVLNSDDMQIQPSSPSGCQVWSQQTLVDNQAGRTLFGDKA